MNLSQFVQWAIAQGSLGKYNDGQYVGQCVSLINQYCWRVLNVPADAWGNAKDWASNANVMRYFTPVGGTPQSGDILVYGAAYGGGDGHIEIALGNGQALEQNRGWDGRIHQRAILPGYSTILRFKGNIPKEETMPKIQNTPNWKARFWKIHHMFIPWDMSDEVFGSIVGQEAWTVVENWNDHPGVEEQLKNIAIGKLARQDNWEDQIHRLVAQVNELSKRPTQEQLDALTKQAADLQASAKAASEAATTAKADAQAKADELAKNEASQAEAKKTADNFLTALINSIFNKFK